VQRITGTAALHAFYDDENDDYYDDDNDYMIINIDRSKVRLCRKA